MLVLESWERDTPIFFCTQIEVREENCDCSGRQCNHPCRERQETKCIVRARSEET